MDYANIESVLLFRLRTPTIVAPEQWQMLAHITVIVDAVKHEVWNAADLILMQRRCQRIRYVQYY
jgi:hypothetical protein